MFGIELQALKCITELLYQSIHGLIKGEYVQERLFFLQLINQQKSFCQRLTTALAQSLLTLKGRTDFLMHLRVTSSINPTPLYCLQWRIQGGFIGFHGNPLSNWH